MSKGAVERIGALTSDLSAKGQNALVDVGLWLYRGFFAPSDYLLAALNTDAPRVAQFLGLDAVDPGGVLSGFISGVVWVSAMVLIVIAWQLVRNFDRAATAFIGRLYEDVQRTGRIVTRRFAIAFRSQALRRQARLARTEVSEQGDLTALELVVLRSHAKLPPGHLSTASDIARALGMRLSHVQKALNKLKTLSLVDRRLGAGDGEDGYRLTRFGAVFLSSCMRAQRS